MTQAINKKEEIILNAITKKDLKNKQAKSKKISITIFALTFIIAVVCGTLSFYFEGQAAADIFIIIFSFTILFLLFLINTLFFEENKYDTLSSLSLKNLKEKIKDDSDLYNKGIALYKKQGFITVEQRHKILKIYQKQKQEKLEKEAEEEMKACLKNNFYYN